MQHCDYCGEFLPCQKEMFYNSYMGNHIDWSFLISFSPITHTYNYICDKCLDAKKIISRKKELQYQRKEEKIKKNWIKKRDKLLKEDKNGRN